MRTTVYAKLRYPNGETRICEVLPGVKIGDRIRFCGSDAVGTVVSIQPTKPDPSFDPEYAATVRTF